MAQSSDNPLLSTKPSDSGITVSLHPLVLLTASDQITRHRVRGVTDPVAGILLGQQDGRQITAEHAFAAGFHREEATGKLIFKEPWLSERVQQYRDVHKAPALDVVGWFTLCPESGPLPPLVAFQKQITSHYNETGILLAIHPEAFEPTDGVNQKLPVTIYESVSETEATKDDTSMQVDGEEPSDLKFRSLPFTVETDEAEMIAIDYVAKGAGSAAAVADTNPQAPTTSQQQPEAEDKKGKKRADGQPAKQSPSTNGTSPALDTLTPEEQDSLATIQTRLNSVRMLQSRLQLLTSYLSTLPASYLSSNTSPLTPDSPSPIHLPHLRAIQALLTRLSLLSTSSPTALEAAQRAQSNDVSLTQLLSMLNHDVQALGELGRKFATVENARSARKKGAGAGGPMNFGDLGDDIMAAHARGMGGRGSSLS